MKRAGVYFTLLPEEQAENGECPVSGQITGRDKQIALNAFSSRKGLGMVLP